MFLSRRGKKRSTGASSSVAPAPENPSGASAPPRAWRRLIVTHPGMCQVSVGADNGYEVIHVRTRDSRLGFTDWRQISRNGQTAEDVMPAYSDCWEWAKENGQVQEEY